LNFLPTAQAPLAVLEGLFFRVDRGIEAFPPMGMKRVDVSGADLVKFRTAAAGQNSLPFKKGAFVTASYLFFFLLEANGVDSIRNLYLVMLRISAIYRILGDF
jgi:hypothetical protein